MSQKQILCLRKLQKKLMRFPENLHFCENCYIWGKVFAGTVKVFPFSVIYSLAHDGKIV